MSYRKVAITTGDVDGIGLEVSVKALSHIGPQAKTQFYLFRSPDSPTFKLPKLRRVQVGSLPEALKLDCNRNQLIEVVQRTSPAVWVEEVASACLDNQFHSMATAPLSKQEIQAAGFRDIGHTDILKRISGRSQAYMAFFGPKFNVLLVSGHIPMKKAEAALTDGLLKHAIFCAIESRSLLPKASMKKPLGILGLNPHAGDRGLIGQFEEARLKPLIQSLALGKSAVGPLVPDAAFQPENWRRFSFYVALYHDQGLIPFKMAHGFDVGAHLTLGLPIRRSSVDHGTAKDLFGKNKARPGSMIAALKWAMRLANQAEEKDNICTKT